MLGDSAAGPSSGATRTEVAASPPAPVARTAARPAPAPARSAPNLQLQDLLGQVSLLPGKLRRLTQDLTTLCLEGLG